MDINIRATDSPQVKQQAWNEIKKYPDCANFITEMSKAFGKPQSIHFKTRKVS